MFRFQLGYRHADGGLRGYVGYGFAEYSARDHAVRQIRERCIELGERPLLCGPSMRVVMGRSECTQSEFKALRGQWKMIRDAHRKNGASIV